MEAAFEYRVFEGTAPNPPGAGYVNGVWTGIPEYSFGTGTKIMYVFTHDNRAVYRFSFDGVVWGSDIELYDAPQAEPFYLSAQKFQVQNRISGSFAVWQLIGMW